jgi:hypothetical protein
MIATIKNGHLQKSTQQSETSPYFRKYSNNFWKIVLYEAETFVSNSRGTVRDAALFQEYHPADDLELEEKVESEPRSEWHSELLVQKAV